MRLHVDQIGYLMDGKKIAVLVADAGEKPGEVRLVREDGDAEAIIASVSELQTDDTAAEQAAVVDFSACTTPGTYHLEETGSGVRSDPFAISARVYHEVKKGMLKAFYYQRCGCALPETCAGVYARPACHCRDAVLYEDRTRILPVRGGWHDAGDFGRYPSAAATSLGHLLYAWELFPERLSDDLTIPESGNGVPDLLNECRYELEFLLQMQAEDGGVYHKVTTMRHPDFLMPQDDDGELLVFPVSSVSTGAMAAVWCIASRVYEPYDADFARSCFHAAAQAGQWLLTHPENVEFHNPEGCNTGEYDDDDDTDERLWAFGELLRTDPEITHEGDRSHGGAGEHRVTRQEQYRRQIAELWVKSAAREHRMLAKYDEALAKGTDVPRQAPILSDGFGWTDVTTLAILGMLRDPAAGAGEETLGEMRQILLAKADRLVAEQGMHPYRLAMQPRDFTWGSNMVVTNRADLLILAAILAPDRAAQYEAAALEQLHYLFGRNAMHTSYVTGFGTHAFRNPHNRVTACDGIDEPIPGEVSGGPSYPPLDPRGEELVPKGSAPQYCYADHVDCYSLNEITIYWNSSAVFAAAYFDR